MFQIVGYMKTDRRNFIKKAGMVAGGIYIIPRHVMGRGYTAPSDKLNIACIGVGGKGQSDCSNVWDNGKNNIVAIADVDWNRGKAAAEKFPNAKKYTDYRKLFEAESKNIDAVTISTPDHQHAIIAMDAMSLGKHVYLQKPLTHDIHEARMLTEAASKYQVVTQMGNQGASGRGTAQFVDWFRKGEIGKVHTVYIWTDRPVWPQGIPKPNVEVEMPNDLAWDLWVGTAPTTAFHPLYHPFKWRGWWDFGTGALGDMGCHLIDPPYRALGLGYPTQVQCSVGSVFSKDWIPDYNPESCPPSSTVQLNFSATKFNKSDVKMIWMDGGLRPFHPDLIPADDLIGDPDGKNGVIMMGTKGILTCGTYGNHPKIYMKGKKVRTLAPLIPNEGTINAPENGHPTLWTEACKTGFGSKEHKMLTSSFDFAGPLTETILMGNLAIRSYNYKESPDSKDFPGRKKLLWDGVNMKITNFEAANQYVKRNYRTGW